MSYLLGRHEICEGLVSVTGSHETEPGITALLASIQATAFACLK